MTAASPVQRPFDATALVVDDEPDLRSLLCALLGRLASFNVRVIEAASAEEALPLLRGEGVDVVVTDHRMGALTGVDLLERVSREMPGAARILVTGLGDPEIAIDAVNRGRIDGFLRKPFEPSDFLTLVDSVLLARVPPPSGNNAAPPEPDSAMDLEAVDHALRRLRVQFGVGVLSAEGFRQMSEELRSKRAAIERRMLERGELG